MHNKNKKILIGCGICFLIFIFGLMVLIIVLRDSGKTYVENMKDKAYSKVIQLSEDKEKISILVDMYKDKSWRDSEECLSEGLIAMQNGEWIAYYYRTSKQDSLIRNISCAIAGRCPYDIFLGKASDGKWYTTNYHYCINMLMLKINDSSQSLNSFKEEYELREMPEPNQRHNQ